MQNRLVQIRVDLSYKIKDRVLNGKFILSCLRICDCEYVQCGNLLVVFSDSEMRADVLSFRHMLRTASASLMSSPSFTQ